jgi:hypothetical protein
MFSTLSDKKNHILVKQVARQAVRQPCYFFVKLIVYSTMLTSWSTVKSRCKS